MTKIYCCISLPINNAINNQRSTIEERITLCQKLFQL